MKWLRRSLSFEKLAIYLLLIFFALLFLLPIFIAVNTAFKPPMEAAALDGSGIVGYYWKILLPVGRAGIAATLILQFRAIWNEFLFGLTLTQSTKTIPVTVYLQSFVSRTEVQWGPLMAAALITILPTIVVFLVFKKHFVKGLAGVYK